ncbi:MAG: hypothetical protein DKM50_02405 [Candidatus Margulisiibacteriota bacterium]|nr:MAG: hypothetical protein A2X43_06855 [Candidatus Margulisbacteria bacterium GWD2_39_127]OGI05262.1 MAG: hypothetical protein A2X42_03630 [Candidatus Margulisbacteria bacterium GWF2_38_17]OGI10879.1 MAG: hypothetical protein A2X41_05845 [Candidatus Margulisbacteria bacterium GWE2_39_32]PZM83567.1 MAG: hypothetical protein DKM50_02405 [Candidatus Margulisiibacteriota bacterium]HAR64255.1 hypothetical protein [Candidatus Margulisiibacteriota bacterium]
MHKKIITINEPIKTGSLIHRFYEINELHNNIKNIDSSIQLQSKKIEGLIVTINGIKTIFPDTNKTSFTFEPAAVIKLTKKYALTHRTEKNEAIDQLIYETEQMLRSCKDKKTKLLMLKGYSKFLSRMALKEEELRTKLADASPNHKKAYEEIITNRDISKVYATLEKANNEQYNVIKDLLNKLKEANIAFNSYLCTIMLSDRNTSLYKTIEELARGLVNESKTTEITKEIAKELQAMNKATSSNRIPFKLAEGCYSIICELLQNPLK